MPIDPDRQLNLDACGCRFVVRCADDELAALVQSVFGRLAGTTAEADRVPDRTFDVERARGGRGFRLHAAGLSLSFDAADALLFHLDKEIILALQRLRPDLFFVHGAAVAWQGQVAVLSAAPGTGKSTLALVALRLGLDYFSDELAPIDLDRLMVHAYPRALYLKSAPPPPHALPRGTIDHGGRYHVPPHALTGSRRGVEGPLAALIFLKRDAERFAGLRPVSAASGAARLIANALNLLAHPADGIDAAVDLSQAKPCFELDVTDLQAASEAIRSGL